MGGTIALVVILVFMFVLMFITSKKQRKMQEEQMSKISELKEGDKVRTHIGIYATIKSFYDSTDGKIAVLELGNGDNKIEFEMEMRLIAGLDQKTEVNFDEEDDALAEANKENQDIKDEEIEKAKEDIKEKLEEKEEKFDDENDGNE